MENIEEKFKKLMKREGMEHLTKPAEERFKETMEKAGFEKLAKSKVYIAKMDTPTGPVELERFKTKEEREEWYKKEGISIEDTSGWRIEFIEGEEGKEEDDGNK